MESIIFPWMEIAVRSEGHLDVRERHQKIAARLGAETFASLQQMFSMEGNFLEFI